MQQTSPQLIEDSSGSKHWLKKIGLLSLPLLAGQLVSKGLNFVAFYLITRSLGLEGFGLWVWAFSLVAMAAAGWGFGLQVWLSKTSAKRSQGLIGLKDLLRKTIQIRLGALVGVSAFGGGWLFFVSPPSHASTPANTIMVTLVAIFIGFLFRTSSELCSAFLRGQLMTWPDGLALFIARLCFVLLLFGYAHNDELNLTQVGYCFCISEVVAAILTGLIFVTQIRPILLKEQQSPKPPNLVWKRLLQEVSLYGGLLIASAFLFRVGMLFSGHHLDTADLGTFAVLHRLNEFSLFLPEAMAAVLLPFWTLSNKKASQQQLWTTAGVMSLGGFGVGMCIYTFGPWLLPFIFETEHQRVAPWLWVLIPLFALQFTNQALLANYMARNEEKQALLILSGAGLCALIGMWLFAQNSLYHLILVILVAEGLFTFGALVQRRRTDDSN